MQRKIYTDEDEAEKNETESKKKRKTRSGEIEQVRKQWEGPPLEVESAVDSVLLSDKVIELQRTDVSTTSSYHHSQNKTINLDGVCAGSHACTKFAGPT